MPGIRAGPRLYFTQGSTVLHLGGRHSLARPIAKDASRLLGREQPSFVELTQPVRWPHTYRFAEIVTHAF
jgi:hypothetical protein